MDRSHNFFARRLLITDIKQALSLAEGNRDFSFFTQEFAYALIKNGEGWCCTQNDEIVAVGGFIPLFAQCGLCDAVNKTRLFSPRTVLALPIFVRDGFVGKGRFFEWCFSRAASKNEVICALLPIKSGTEALPFYFSMGLCLSAMRPLFALRAYYMFSRGVMQIPREGSLFLNLSDTHSISRFLENGYCGVDVQLGAEPKLELVKFSVNN